MKHLLSKASAIALILSAGSAIPTQSFAQTATVDEDEIIVTARARAESIQDVPLAITAFTAEALEKQSIQDLDDVARFTSGFSFEDFSGGFAQPVIRGQAQTRVTALESNVSTFFDGIYLPRSWNVDLGTTNLQRIEVVKGPQSARYGRNAFAGAINYIPRKADIGTKLAGELSGTVGSDDRYDVGGFINVAETDKVAVSASFNHSSYDGSWENRHPFADSLDLDRGTDGNVGGWSNTSYSASAIFRPFERLTLEGAYYNFDIESEARASAYNTDILGIGNCGARRVPGDSTSPFRLRCGEFDEPQDTTLNDPRGYGTYSNTDIVRLAANFELSDSLDLSYTFGKIQGDVDIGTSGEPDPINCGGIIRIAVPYCNFQNAPRGGISYDSHEARLSFDNGGQFRGAIGGFLSDGQDDYRFTSVNVRPIVSATDFDPVFGTPESAIDFSGQGPLNLVLQDDVTTTDVKSVFAEVHWTSADGATRLGAEGRLTETDLTVVSGPRTFTFGVPGLEKTFNETFNVFTPRFTAERDLNDNSLLFASIARGTKAGGFNTGVQDSTLEVFGEEFNWTYEIGSKNTFADGRWTLNGSIYFTDWTEIQVNSGDPSQPDPNALTITQNLGDATLLGFELDTRYLINDNLSVDANFSHTEGKYKDGTLDNRFARTPTPCDNVVCNTNGDIGGNKIERAAPTQASAGIQWEAPMQDFGNDYYIRGDVSWQSKFYADSANLSQIPSRFLVNGRAGLNFDNFEVSIWARNLLDEKYVSNAFIVLLSPPQNPNTYGTFFGERRSFGLTGKLKFD